MFVFLTISLVERKCETSYLFISLFMYFWIELQKFQSRLKTKNSENIWKQISQNISCREMRFCPQSSNKLYLLQKDFSEKSFSYYHLTGTSFPRGQPHNNKPLGECQAKAKIVWAKGHQIVAKYSNYGFNSEGNVVGSERFWKRKRFHSVAKWKVKTTRMRKTICRQFL